MPVLGLSPICVMPPIVTLSVINVVPFGIRSVKVIFVAFVLPIFVKSVV
ncbi:putative membrane protein [Bacillus cereus]|nr:putative membrane protein [Bacillus cereus]